jgi:hypothetical protein
VKIDRMSISEQIKKLRKMSQQYPVNIDIDLFERTLNQAADTIESLSEKLAAANEELKRWHTDKVNEKIKNPFAWTSTLYCHNCDHKDEYIEELEASDMERSAEDCGGGWIPCKERIPEEKINPVTDDFYEYEVTFKQGDVIDIRHYKFGRGHWWNYGMLSDDCVIAWREHLEPYHEP